ncbi:MAG: hypothetical protein HGA19_16270 [Oscillochloris sp.]|nr:hypothetical protein [Oscillochloris sp.]
MWRKLTLMLTIVMFTGLGTAASASFPPHSHAPRPSATPARATAYFPMGVFEDAHMIAGDTAGFAIMLTDLKARSLDSVLFTNNDIAEDAALLDVADPLGMRIFMMPATDWNENWWLASIPASQDLARRAAAPAVAAYASHTSFAGYTVKDEPTLEDRDKIRLLTQVIHELDPAHPVTAILVGEDRVKPIFSAANLDILLIDIYPVAYDNPPCDLTMNGFGYPWHDFVSYIRFVATDRAPTTALWVILQTHSFDNWLRQPLPSEVRMQQWLAVGEGAHGIFWFTYSSQQGWLGLSDNEALYSEVTDLAQRLDSLRAILLDTVKVPDQFTVVGGAHPYISTLTSAEGRTFALAVNRDCQYAQLLEISSPAMAGDLHDVESGQVYRQGQPIEFQPGDGRLFEIISESFMPILMLSKESAEYRHVST